MKQTVVMVVATMHGFHRDHPTYDYDRLFEVVEGYEPDYVGVEIRPEDVGADGSYLAKNYPFEMVELVRRYGPERSFGFDWLGEDIAGRPIPDDYWQIGSAYKRLERELNADADFESAILEDLYTQQMAIIEGVTTPGSLNDGRYDAVTRRYYEVMDELLAGTKYWLISEFRQRRDREIGEHIVDFIRGHWDGRIALVMGANHRVYVMEALERFVEDGEIVLVGPV